MTAAVSPLRFVVRVTPRGGRDSIDGWERDAAGRMVLRLRVAAAPDDGAANRAVERLIAEELDLPKRAVRIAAGFTSRVKQVELSVLPDPDNPLMRQIAANRTGPMR